MTKRSAFERRKRAAETARVGEIERAWRASVAPDVLGQFDRHVAAMQARGPLPAPPDMAPGTKPNPPRPGREPKPPKADGPTRRGR